MSAISNVRISPEPALDQTETYKAINELQSFLNKFPASERKDTCNYIIDKLRTKLEVKAYNSAKLYYKMENYKSSSVAMDNFLKEFPNTKYKEEILYLIVKSDYLLAENSIKNKKMERFEKTIKSYRKFVANFPESKYIKEVKNFGENAEKQLQLIKNEEIN